MQAAGLRQAGTTARVKGQGILVLRTREAGTTAQAKGLGMPALRTREEGRLPDNQAGTTARVKGLGMPVLRTREEERLLDREADVQAKGLGMPALRTREGRLLDREADGQAKAEEINQGNLALVRPSQRPAPRSLLPDRNSKLVPRRLLVLVINSLVIRPVNRALVPHRREHVKEHLVEVVMLERLVLPVIKAERALARREEEDDDDDTCNRNQACVCCGVNVFGSYDRPGAVLRGRQNFSNVSGGCGCSFGCGRGQ
jgi:hypothetical protein